MTSNTVAYMGTNTGNHLLYGARSVANPAIEKTIDLTNYPHTKVILFNYCFIDSCDRTRTQRGQMNSSSDGSSYTNVWSKCAWTEVGTNFININDSYGDSYAYERSIFYHTGNTLCVRFTSTGLGLPSSDFSWEWMTLKFTCVSFPSNQPAQSLLQRLWWNLHVGAA